METFKAIINRKGVRDFNQQPVSKAQLHQIIQAANAAPISGGGFRDSDRHLTIIQNTADLKLIASAAGGSDGNNPLYDAPTLLVLSAPENSFHAEQLDVGLMAQNILLAATDLGLNAIVMTSIISVLRTNDQLISRLKFPDKYQPFLGVVIGHTDDDTVKTRAFRDDNVDYIL